MFEQKIQELSLAKEIFLKEEKSLKETISIHIIALAEEVTKLQSELDVLSLKVEKYNSFINDVNSTFEALSLPS
jgi:hypothetical protein